MADPLRRTLLAKLRGKKSKKGATIGGGYGSAAAAAATAAATNGGREGKEKVLQTRRDSDETRPLVVLTGMDCTTGRMSTYENCVDGPTTVQSGQVVIVRQGRAAELAGTRPQERCGGGRVRVNEHLPGVSLQRAAPHGGHAAREGERSHRAHRSGGRIALSAAHQGAHVPGKHFVSVPRQCSVGDSIGFGDNSNHLLYRARADTHTGVGKPAACRVHNSDSDVTEPRDSGHSRHMAATVVAVQEHNANWSFDNNQTLEAARPGCTAPVDPDCALSNAEEKTLIRIVESYGPESDGEVRGTVSSLQSPTFFPTELEICDINTESLCATEESLRYTLDSEDEDYYDNEILPFYETIRVKSDRGEVVELPQSGQDKGDEGNIAQETDRLRNQLKEAYYLLINAMNDINLDLQQISGGSSEQRAVSSCSSHSRDSLCSRLSAKNMDSDSWSSGGDHSPQQVSDTDSLLLCLSGNHESDFRCLKSKSMEDLCVTKKRPPLTRSASDRAIRYSGGPSLGVQAPGVRGKTGAIETKETGVGESSGPGVLGDAVSSDERLQDGELNESSGSVNSLTGSSDSSGDALTSQGRDNKQEPTGARVERSNSVNKAHGVTVNKMQEWMHKGRLLSSEMKQRIEGSPSPRGGAQCQDRSCPPAAPVGCKAAVQTSARGVISVKAKSPTVKSPRHQQPGRKATRSGLDSRGPSKSETCRPPSHSLIIVILLHS